MNIADLEDEVISLIDSKREDDYWDFKQCYHKNKADLLHDIICMANNRSNHDGYIIFGIQDKTFNIIGVEKDELRKAQQNIIDFLKSKSFSNDTRPKINLVTLNIYQHSVDVLIVYNTLETPYYLTKDYKDNNRTVRANYIYTRVGDTNTDIDKSADSNHVEYLWKKRFGIHLTPFEKLRYILLQKSKWKVTENFSYYIQNPEYTLIRDIDYEYGRSAEFYAYNMDDTNVMYGTISVNYFGTKLYDNQTVSLDGGRYITVVPEWGTISQDKYHRNTDSFKYFIKDDILYDLHRYLINEDSYDAVYAHKRFMDVVLLFENDYEKKCFTTYVENNLDLFETIISGNKSNYDYLDIESPEKEQVIRRLKVAKALKEMQSKFYEANSSKNEEH